MNKTEARVAYGVGALVLIAAVAFVVPRFLGPTAVAQSAKCDAMIASNYCDSGGTKCTVTVALTDCTAGPTVTPPTLSVCKQNTKITWVLNASASAAGAKFAGNGLDFKGEDDFQNGGQTDTTYEWKDKHSKQVPPSGSLPYPYGIHILTSQAGTCYDKDPLVSNE
jgi:hypothetical protein